MIVIEAAMKELNRRQFLATLPMHAVAQQLMNGLRFMLVRDYPGWCCKSVSPTKHQAVLAPYEQTVVSFRQQWPSGGFKRLGRNSNSTVLMDLDTGRVIRTLPFGGLDLVSFFGSGRRLMADQIIPTKQVVIVDLDSEEVPPKTIQRDGTISAYAAGDDHFLGPTNGDPYQGSVRLQAVDSAIFVRSEPIVPEGVGRQTGHSSAGYVFAPDRRTYIHAIRSSMLVLRDCLSLKPKWTANVKSLPVLMQLAISADGRWIASAFRDNELEPNVKDAEIVVLNGHDGSVYQRFPAHGWSRLAISPDGSMVAAARRLATDSSAREFILTVGIYDTKTGVEIVRLPQERLKIKGTSLTTYFNGLAFTSDGEYLLASAQTTKQWKVVTR